MINETQYVAMIDYFELKSLLQHHVCLNTTNSPSESIVQNNIECPKSEVVLTQNSKRTISKKITHFI